MKTESNFDFDNRMKEDQSHSSVSCCAVVALTHDSGFYRHEAVQGEFDLRLLRLRILYRVFIYLGLITDLLLQWRVV